MNFYEYTGFIRKELNSIKTIPSRKRFLSKEIKGLKENLKDMKEAHSRPDGQRFLFGEKISKLMIDNREREIKYIEELRSQLN